MDKHHPEGVITAQHTAQQRRVCLAASLWAFLFAAVSFYWAMGGQLGSNTVGVWAEQASQTREPVFVFTLWVTALLKALLGLLPLALVQGWLDFLPRRLLILTMGLVGAGIALYYLANLIQHILMLSGIMPVANSLGQEGLIGHLIFWDPWWILGGILFIVAARTCRSR
jgi:Protein of unknown function (DUF3995)